MPQLYYRENIKLEEAMTKDIQQKIRIWKTKGIYIKDENISHNVNSATTFVMKTFDGHFEVGVGGDSIKAYIVAKISDFEELKSKFPQLFELDGKFYAYESLE